MAPLLLDTHVLIWVPAGDRRMHASARAAIESADALLFVSAVIAFELTDLQRRGRIAMTEPIAMIGREMVFEVVDFPADAWRVLTDLPSIHGDPVDRMLISHAIAGDFTIVTANAAIRAYPVKTLW